MTPPRSAPMTADSGRGDAPRDLRLVQDRPQVGHWLSELIADPTLEQPPQAVIPYCAFREHVTMLFGREKRGKTSFLASCVAKATRGQSVLGAPAQPPINVLIYYEESRRLTRRRYEKVGADPLRLFLVPLRELRTDKEFLATLPFTAEFQLVVVDTVQTLFDLLGIENENDAAEMMMLSGPLMKAAQTYKAAWWLNHHAKKDGLDYRGSGALGGQVDQIMGFEEQPDNVRKFHVLGRLEVEDFSARYDGTHYTLVSGAKQMAADALTGLITAAVARNPGASTNRVCEIVGGNREKCRHKIDSLIRLGVLTDAHREKPGRGAKLYVTETTGSSGTIWDRDPESYQPRGPLGPGGPTPYGGGDQAAGPSWSPHRGGLGSDAVGPSPSTGPGGRGEAWDGDEPDTDVHPTTPPNK